MHRTPVEIIPKCDLIIDGVGRMQKGSIYNVDYKEFDRKTGAIRFRVPPLNPSYPGGENLCSEWVTIPKERLGDFRIRWELIPSTDGGWKIVQLGALAFLAPLWIGADLLIASSIPGLKQLGHRIHPKRGH
jgi:hypothetical protein